MGQTPRAEEGWKGWRVHPEGHMRDIQHISREGPQYHAGVRNTSPQAHGGGEKF